MTTLIISMILILSLGQQTSADGPVRTTSLKRMDWKVGEVTREALVYSPERTKSAPIVFVWHGHGGNMRNSSGSFAIHKLWPEAVVVYPQGIPTPGLLFDRGGKLPGWQSNPGQNDDRDLKFFDAMLETFKREQKVDPARVFVTGHSNGGRFVYLLWATRAKEVAAVAPSSSPATGLLDRMKPKPCLHIAGETDRLVAYANQKRTMDRVRSINGCDAEPKTWGEFSGKVSLYGSTSGTPVVTAICPGGHEFPKEAPTVVVKFFKSLAKG